MRLVGSAAFLGVVTGCLAIGWRAGAGVLTPASECSGLVEHGGALLLGAFPTWTVGDLLRVSDRATLALAVATLVIAGRRWGISAVVSVTIGLAVAAGATLPQAFAPPRAAVAFALAAAAAAALSLDSGDRAVRRVWGIVAALAGTLALVAPALPCGLQPAAPVRAVVARLVDAAGPLALALAAAQLVARPWWRLPIGRTIALAAIGLIAAATLGADPVVALAPVLVVIWLLAARTADDLVAPLGGWRRGVAVAIAATVLLWLQVNHRQDVSGDTAVAPLGHERWSVRDFSRLAALLPDGALLVEEDASIDLLLKAGGAAHVGTVPASREAVAAALDRHPTFALPLARRDLQHRGVRWELVEAPRGVSERWAVEAFATLARVWEVRPCAAVEGGWTDVTPVVLDTVLSLVADDDSAHGPVLLYLASERPLGAAPDGWPKRATRGFWVRTFDRSRPAHRDALDADLRKDRARADLAGFDASFVTRFEVWRTPGAPLALGIRFGQPAAAGIARLLDATTAQGTLRLCPSAGS